MEKVLLVFPREGMERWEGIVAPPSVLFLSAGLKEKGFEVDFSFLEVQSLTLSPPRKLSHYFAIGITLFDDFFLQEAEFAERIPEGPLVALGGITPTMAPLEVFYLFPKANIIFPGEGDRAFGEVLASLKEGKIPRGPWGIRLGGKEKPPQPIPIRESLSRVFPDLSLAEQELEIVLTRGCPRSCIFCTHAHGRLQRRTPLSSVRNWMREFRKKGGERVNLADDDILLDPDYAKEVFRIIGEEGLKIWGVQTSMDSLRLPGAIEALRKAPFVAEPILWIGTDAFLDRRAKRLAKRSRQRDIMWTIEKLEDEGIKNYHYWILTDCLSELEEFVEEFSLVGKLIMNFPGFHLLPNAPFLIPYPYTPAFKRALRLCPERVVYRRILRRAGIKYPLVLLEKPADEVLFHFLNPERTLIPWTFAGEFVEHLRQGKVERAASLLLTLTREQGLDPSPIYRIFEHG